MATSSGHHRQSEEIYCGGGVIGLNGSSTRCETTSWIFTITLPFWIMYATDSASMLAKAKKIINAAVADMPKNQC